MNNQSGGDRSYREKIITAGKSNKKKKIFVNKNETACVYENGRDQSIHDVR